MGCDIHGIIQVKKDGIWKDKSPGYDERNYPAFSLIADVRNAFGVNPISKPRGFPKEIYTESVLKIKQALAFHEPAFCDDENYRGGVWFGDHSHSYLYAKELLEFNWDAPVYPSDPDSETYKEFARGFYEDFVLAQIKPLSDIYGAENVRWVFGFDS